MDMTRRGILKLGVASMPAASVLTGLFTSAAADEEKPAATADVSAIPVEGGLKGAFVGFRIGVPIWLDEARFKELLDMFDRHPGVTDEITLFTSETHPPLPIAVIQDRADILKTRMEFARNRGYRVGINVLATIGHHEENLPNSLTGEYTFMTDPSGAVCRGVYCPSDERYRVYIAQVYEAVANAKPDYIWIDDDVRLYGHMPIKAGCFCDACVQRFGKRVEREFNRTSLRAALSSGDRTEKLRLRLAFLQHNRDTLSDLFRFIEKKVHGAVPDLPLGFMTGDRFYEGYDFDTWAEVLAGPQKATVMWRPGGGAYRDERMANFIDKAHDIGRQVALLPGEVRCIESEVESFPYQRLKKSAHATAMEASAYIASGCTGAAFNVMSQYDEPLDEYASLVHRLHEARPFLDLLARALGRAPSIGIHSGWNKDTYAAANPDGEWFEGPGAPGHCNEIWATGLPAAYRFDQASVTVWSGDQVLALSEEEIRTALRQGVYIDGPALTRLNELGLGALTGFEVAEVRDIDCIEELTKHPINGVLEGRRRNGRQSFYRCPTYLFRPTAEGAQSLARCVDYTYHETAPCCLGAYGNGEGGRVCVAGYYPWEQLQNLSKSSQLKSIMRWLSKDTLPAYVASFHRMNLWVRRRHAGTTAIAMLNASQDPAHHAELLVHTGNDQMRLFDMRGEEIHVASEASDGPYRRFALPPIAPWEMVLALV
jgi:hypothetical protein